MFRESNDQIVQGRCKAKDLAIVAQGLINLGIPVPSTSALVREAIQWLSYSLTESGDVKPMSKEDAKDFLTSLGTYKAPSKYKIEKRGGYVGDRARANRIEGANPDDDMTPEQLAEVYKDSPEVRAAKERVRKNNSKTD